MIISNIILQSYSNHNFKNKFLSRWFVCIAALILCFVYVSYRLLPIIITLSPIQVIYTHYVYRGSALGYEQNIYNLQKYIFSLPSLTRPKIFTGNTRFFL